MFPSYQRLPTRPFLLKTLDTLEAQVFKLLRKKGLPDKKHDYFISLGSWHETEINMDTLRRSGLTTRGILSTTDVLQKLHHMRETTQHLPDSRVEYELALWEAVSLGEMLLELEVELKMQADAEKGRAAKERGKHVLKPHRDELAAEADEFWEDWRRLYRQRVDLFGDRPVAAAIRYVRSEMTKRSAAQPKTGKVPSERRCWDQLLREPTIDWRPEPIQ